MVSAQHLWNLRRCLQAVDSCFDMQWHRGFRLVIVLTVESSRLFRPVWKVSNFQAIENKEIRSMGDARISILEVLKNQILRRTFRLSRLLTSPTMMPLA